MEVVAKPAKQWVDHMRAALDWYKRNGKEPVLTAPGGLWRWALPDAGYETDRRPEELPGKVFDRLQGEYLPGNEGLGFPWLFRTRHYAIGAAIFAVAAAMEDGWQG